MVHVKMVIKIISGKLHKNGVSFPEDGCHKTVQQFVTCLCTLFLSSWYLKLPVKPLICPLANEAMRGTCV